MKTVFIFIPLAGLLALLWSNRPSLPDDPALLPVVHAAKGIFAGVCAFDKNVIFPDKPGDRGGRLAELEEVLTTYDV